MFYNIIFLIWVIAISSVLVFLEFKSYEIKRKNEDYQEGKIKVLMNTLWIILFLTTILQIDNYLKKMSLLIISIIYGLMTTFVDIRLYKQHKSKNFITSIIVKFILFAFSIYIIV